MVCRCSSPAEHARRAEAAAYESQRWGEEHHKKQIAELEARVAAFTAPPTKFEIVALHEASHTKRLALKVRYPSCTACEYEGTKILVFENVTLRDVVFWREIDPHFRAPQKKDRAAPSPIARFPGNDAGWKNAVRFADGG